MKHYVLFVLVTVLLQGCAYVQAPPRFNTTADAIEGVPSTGRLTLSDARENANTHNTFIQQRLAIKKMQQTSIFYDPVKGYRGALINEDPYDSFSFDLTGPETASYNIGPRTILIAHLIPGLYKWRVSNGENIKGEGELTVGLQTFFVDEKYYLQKKFRKINEQGKNIEQLDTEHHFRVTNRRHY